MTLSYSNPSLSEMASDDESRASRSGGGGHSDNWYGETMGVQEEQDQPPQHHEPRRPSSIGRSMRQVVLTIILCSGLMFACLDTSIVSTALVSVCNEFQEESRDAPWAVLGYLLTYMSFAVGFSRLSDVYGRRNIVATAWLLFTLGSVWCGTARRMGELIAGRAVQGIGGSGLYSLAQVCLVEQGPSRPEVVGALVGITLSVSFVLGPLLGGAIAEWNWRGIFWFNVPFGILAVLGIYTFWSSDRRYHHDPQSYNPSTGAAAHPMARIDLLGNLLLAAGSILLVLAMQQAGSLVWAWSSPAVIASLSAAGACWILLVLWEWYLFSRSSPTPGGVMTQQQQPVFPVKLAKDRVYMSCLVVTLLAGFIYIALLIKLPECLQIARGDSALQAGVHLLPMLGGCALGSFLGGALSKRSNLTCQTLCAGSTLQVAGLALVYGFGFKPGFYSSSSYQPWTPDGPNPKDLLDLPSLLGFTAVYGLGVGLSFAACTMIAAVEAQSDELAAAQGAVAQARVLGGAIGLAACTILAGERLKAEFAGYGPMIMEILLGINSSGGEEGTGVGAGGTVSDELRQLTAARGGELPEGLRRHVTQVYLDAFGEQVLLLLAVAGVALMLSLGTYRRRPGHVVQVMMQHKGLAGRAAGSRDDVELCSVSSVRSLAR